MSKSNASKTFLVSDESINSYGFRVLTSGIDIAAFEGNPVLLYMHRRGKVFGTWINLIKTDGKMYADPVFDLEDTDEEIQTIAGKVDRNVLKAASIGLDIQEAIYSEEHGCYVATKTVLEEISIVDIGSNRNAIRLYSNGQPLEGEDLTNKLAQLSAPQSAPISTTPPIQTMSFKNIAIALALAESATEHEVLLAIATLSSEKGYKKKFEDLHGSLAAEQKIDAEVLVNEAIADKRISAEMKDSYIALFAADHKATKAILSKLNKPVDLTQFTQQTTNLSVDDKAKEAAVALYDKKDKDGSLIQLKAGNPQEYERLFEAKWGRKPSK